jgi:hypothetical protein
MSLRAHARVGQDLRDGIASGGGLFAPIRFAKGLDVIERVVVGDELERVGYAVDDVLLSDHGHGFQEPIGCYASLLLTIEAGF